MSMRHLSLPEDDEVLLSVKKYMQNIEIENQKIIRGEIRYSDKVYYPAGAISSYVDNEYRISFSNKINQIIVQKAIAAPDVYKRARLDRRLFSKMMSDNTYKPSKDTVVALCFGLKLPLKQSNELLECAGFTLSHGLKRDIIIEYFIVNEIFDVDELNSVLYEMGEHILGRI